MLIQDYASASDFELLGTNFQTPPEYSETIENASQDSLRCWLLKHHYTNRELDALEEAGITLQELAADLEAQGNTFP